MSWYVETGKWLVRHKGKLTLGAYGAAAGVASYNDVWGDVDKLPDIIAGEILVQFPEDKSAGDFWTEMTFFTWKHSTSGIHLDKGVNTQSSEQKTDFLGILRLPMPLQLSTAYTGKFSEADDMNVDRGNLGGGWSVAERAIGIYKGGFVEAKKGMNALANLNNTASMSNASINNNNMGMKYEGANLRGHSFTWRLSAKSQSEQNLILKVIATLKGMSLPANNWGGREDYENFKRSIQAMNASATDEAKKADGYKPFGTADSVGGGRLTIPPTVTVRFLDGDEENPSLFKIKDSFITNVEINYTSQGSWQAHHDGSPMEVQISITLKEVKMITRQDVMSGY